MSFSTMPILTQRFHIVLKAIYDYIEKFGKPPYRTNAWLVKQRDLQINHITSNHITQIKIALVKAKFITDDTYLTPKGKEYIRQHFGQFVVKSIEIRVQGTATAGPTDVNVEIDDLVKPSDNTIEIPAISSKDVFAVRVQGISMEKEGILNGDFVIVEKQDSLWWPSPQDMIVASYLPSTTNYEEMSQISPSDYVGPVLKVYMKRFGEKGCELGWRKANENNPYFIQALDLKPIGKVIGIYRDLKSFSLLNSKK